MPPPTNPIDLTTLTAVKKWASVSGAGDDQQIQDCITAFGSYVLTRTGRGPIDGSVPTASPFSSIVPYNEIYDGNGAPRLFLRNTPIQSVVALSINGVAMSASSGYGVQGFGISSDKKSIFLQSGGGGSASFTSIMFGAAFGGQAFVCGMQNIAVQYTAGYAAVPFDLEMTARKVVALNYKRTAWIGQKSQSMAQGAGTISFGDWEMDRDCERVLISYQRRAMV